MYRLLIYLFAVLITSCSYQYNVDQKDVFKLGEALNMSFIRNDLSIPQQVLPPDENNLSKNDLENIEEIMGTITKKASLLKIDTAHMGWPEIGILLYYQLGDQYYEVLAWCSEIENKYYIDNYSFTNMVEWCDYWSNWSSNQIYCPSGEIKFRRLHWETNRTTILSGEIELKNNTNQDINYIKFRLKIGYDKNDYYSSEGFFNQTIESYKTIYKGDIVKIEIPGMRNYYVGNEFYRNETLYDAELIEVLPKAELDRCKVLKELKSIN